jgi:hypothetical protein
MKVNISGKDIFIPKWNSNREAPEAERIRVEYRYLTAEEEEKYTNLIPKYDTKDTSNIELEIKTHANEIWDLCVSAVHNLYDTNNKEITDPKAIRKIPGIYGLVTEVVGKIRQGITEAEIKN